MKKLAERFFKNNYERVYDLENLDKLEFINLLEKNNNISYINLKQDADVGFCTFGGNYSLEKFYEIYPLCKNDIDTMLIALDEINSRIFLNNSNNHAYFITPNQDFDLQDMICQENYKKK